MLRHARILLVALLLAALLFAGCSPLDKRAAIAPDASAALAPRSTSYDVGAYYFSGWSHGPNDNVSELLTKHFPQSEPLIGWYDDSQEAVDRSIDQAANAGIDFFAFDWYDIAQSPYVTDKTLNEGLGFFLTSRERHRLKFCLNWIDFPPFVPPVSDWAPLVNTWITYFQQPDYVRVDGKPLFIVFSPEHMDDIFGGPEGVRRALDYLRASARAAGLPGVTIAVAATITPTANPVHAQILGDEGYDAATGYSYHSLGNEQYRIPVPYQNLVNENTAMWDRVAERLPLPYIPVITSGFDLRYSAREQATAIIYEGRTPQKFACFATLARHWIDTHPTRTTRERIVMIYAWTEMGEGGAIIPNHQDGYAFADAVRAIFGDAVHAPTTPDYCRS